MSVNAAPNRRKVATYGKVSRKPIVAVGECFANATQAGLWNLNHNVLNWERCATHVVSDNVRASNQYIPSGDFATSDRLEKSRIRKPSKHKSPSVLSVCHPGGDQHLSDSPPLVKSPKQGLGEEHVAHRKRRRVSPEPAPETREAVYDDASLQRHIAAGECSDVSRALRSGLMQGSISQNARETRRLSIDGGILEPEKLQIKSDEEALHLQVDVAGRNLSESKPMSIGLTPFRSVQKTKEEIASPSEDSDSAFTPDTPLPQKRTEIASGKQKDSLSPGREFYPVTPPSSGTHGQRRTTPRQKELWDKLLVEDTSITTPSSLDLRVLTMTDRKQDDDSIGRQSRASLASDGTSKHASKHRRNRVVDTLYAQGHGARQKGDCTDEKPESNRTKYFSEVMAVDASDPFNVEPPKRVCSTNSGEKFGRSDVQSVTNTSHRDLPSTIAGPRVTYARQRSYLTDIDMDQIASLSIPVSEEPLETNTSHHKVTRKRTSREQSKQDLKSGQWNPQHSQSGAMRSIHELREAGGNVRLLGELESLLDDIEDQSSLSSNVRRTLLLNLVARFQEPSVTRLFVDHGLEARLLASIGMDNDIVTNSLLSMALFELTTCPSSLMALPKFRDAQVLNFLVGMLETDLDLAAQAKSRDIKLSKYARQEYSSICSSKLRSTVWSAGNPPVLSCHVLALQCLENIIRQTRESSYSSHILSADAIRRIVATSLPPLVQPPLLRTAMSTVPLTLAVSILESCTVSNAADYLELIQERRTFERIVGLLPLLDVWDEDKRGMLRTSTLRLYVNLTNNNPELCEKLCTPEVVGAMCKMTTACFERSSSHASKCQQPVSLDALILGLGTLINLAESCNEARRLIMDLRCGDRSYLAVFLELFATNSQSAAEVYSEEETKLNVAFGYLSVLLGSVCLNREVRTWVSRRLRGGSLHALVDALEEFLQYNRKAGQGQSLDEANTMGGYVSRLQGLVEELKS
ncbi:hypothetical protein ACLMJK_009613 [Lecanora helva]